MTTATSDLTSLQALAIARALYNDTSSDDDREHVSGFAERTDSGFRYSPEYRIGERRFSGDNVRGFGRTWRAAVEMAIRNKARADWAPLDTEEWIGALTDLAIDLAVSAVYPDAPAFVRRAEQRENR